MNKTTNYQLNQWERSDRVLMEDFNADNVKIDAALGALTEGKADAPVVAELSAALDAARGTIPKIAVGTYTGSGSSDRSINVGFAPKAVLVMTNKGETFSNGSSSYYGGLAVTGGPVVTANRPTGGTFNVVSLTSTGFSVYYAYDDISRFYASSNASGITYRYLAIG